MKPFEPQTAEELALAVLDNPMIRDARMRCVSDPTLPADLKRQMLCTHVRIEAVQQARIFARPWTMAVVHAATAIVLQATTDELTKEGNKP